MKKTRILLASDIHNTHIDWYGVKNEERMERFIRDIKAEYKKDPFDALLLLGDYSLDYWAWDIKGCYIKEGVSRSKELVDNYLSKLFDMDFPIAMICGNHEQYGDALWNKFTGFDRKDFLVIGDLLFILLDNYSADLDPTEHSDGTYTPTDVRYIKALMDTYPGKKVFLCAHYFDTEKENEEFKELLRNENRIVCLFHGHTHLSSVKQLSEEFGGKSILQTGNYSTPLTEDDPVKSAMWGFRDLIIKGNKLTSSYITPKNDYEFDGKKLVCPYGTQDIFEAELN